MSVPHILDDELESYSLGRLANEAKALVEEHLLVCDDCRDRLVRWDEFSTAMRGACGTVREVPWTAGSDTGQ